LSTGPRHAARCSRTAPIRRAASNTVSPSWSIVDLTSR
jgi:hypothetical protein